MKRFASMFVGLAVLVVAGVCLSPAWAHAPFRPQWKVHIQGHPWSAATNYSVTTTSAFSALSQSGITNTYDPVGNTILRSFSGGRTQTLTWDAAGRLIRIVDAIGSTNLSTLTAVYDGLGRRLRTVHAPGNGASLTLTTDSWYDPEVEFQEIAVGLNGQRTWKVHGPDLNGVYGGMMGVGGLEATIREADGLTTGVLNDARGNCVATVSVSSGPSGPTVKWASTPVGAYGPVLGYEAPKLSHAVPLAEATLWRSKRIDPSGLYYLGSRYYDPVGGRFISPDPRGHGASLDLYSFADNDPVNRFDPDGRVGKRAWDQAWRGDYATAANGWAGVGGQTLIGMTPIVGQVADLRDTAANLGNVWNNPGSGSAWAGLGMTAVAWVPGIGDFLKGSGKALRQLDDVPSGSLTPSVPHDVGGGGAPVQMELDLVSGDLSGGLAAKTPASLWTKAEFNGTRVYQRNDLIDAALVDARGRSNLQRMQQGLAPIGPDGKSINLHHTIQTADSPLAEMTATLHQQNSRVIHINPNTIPSGIDRPAFDAFRRDYWINRANDFSP